MRSSTEAPKLEVELGDPLTDAELDDVQAKIGFALDPRFVAGLDLATFAIPESPQA